MWIQFLLSKQDYLTVAVMLYLQIIQNWGRKVSGMDREKKKKRMHIAYMQINSLNHL